MNIHYTHKTISKKVHQDKNKGGKNKLATKTEKKEIREREREKKDRKETS